MQSKSISLPELIRYFNGTASASLQARIEQYKIQFPSFAEEMETWKEYVDSFDNQSEAIDRLWELHQEWFESDVTEGNS